jgi:hypothetical protein
MVGPSPTFIYVFLQSRTLIFGDIANLFYSPIEPQFVPAALSSWLLGWGWR